MDNGNTVKRIALLGSTGSIGTQTLSVADAIHAQVDVITAGSNDKLAAAQCRKYNPRIAAMADEAAASRLALELADTDIKVYGGDTGVTDAVAATNADTAVIAISGMAAAMPMITAAHNCRRICMANKEAIVAAGDELLAAISEGGAELIPVDSEHSAIFQCLRAGERGDVARILLTASGGPFYGRSRESQADITPKEALSHPTWQMGAKITVDSATLMNKGFEVIEAMRLFRVPADKIEVVIHRESIIHSMVEYNDGAIIAQLGAPDMRTAIQYAITFPRHISGCARRLSLTDIGRLTFSSPDTDAFPALSMAFDAARRGGSYPAVMSAADEVAVKAFLAGKINFTRIYDIVAETTYSLGAAGIYSLDEIIEADLAARDAAQAKIG